MNNHSLSHLQAKLQPLLSFYSFLTLQWVQGLDSLTTNPPVISSIDLQWAIVELSFTLNLSFCYLKFHLSI